MILIFISLLGYETSFTGYRVDSLKTLNLAIQLKEERGIFKGILEGEVEADYMKGDFETGYSDLILGLGVNRKVMGNKLDFLPMMQFPTGKNNSIKKFTTESYGYGIELGISSNIWYSNLNLRGRFKQFTNKLRTLILSGMIRFNPDTLTFGVDVSHQWFEVDDYSTYLTYIKPLVVLSRWKTVAFSMGIGFLVSPKESHIEELEQAGITTGAFASPSWKFSFNIFSPDRDVKRRNLIPLKMVILNEKGEPMKALMSLADSGSFEIDEGERTFSLPEGIYPLSVYKEGYLPEDTTIILKQKSTIILNMEARKEMGNIEGIVMDRNTENPLDAELRIRNGIYKRTFTEKGNYKIYLPPGQYIIQVFSEGYFNHVGYAEVRKDETTKLNFKLMPKNKTE